MSGDVVRICKGCPHWTECVVGADCLVDIAATFHKANQFSRWMLPEQARAVEQALRSGKSLRDITNSSKSNGKAICTLLKFHNHCADYPLWGAEMQALATANALDKNKLKGRPGQTRGVVRRRRGIGPDNVIERVIWRLILKRSISSFTAGGSPDFLLNHKHFTELRSNHPVINELAEALIKNSVRRAQYKRHKAARAVRANVTPTLSGMLAAQPDPIHTAIEEVMPDNLPPEMRGEIVNNMWLAVREGDVAIDDLGKCVKVFRAAYNKMFPQKYAMQSLDAPAFRDGNIPLIETIEHGLWT